MSGVELVAAAGADEAEPGGGDLLADRFGPDYMYYGIGIGWVLGCGLSVWYYVTGRWKRRFRPPEKREEL